MLLIVGNQAEDWRRTIVADYNSTSHTQLLRGRQRDTNQRNVTQARGKWLAVSSTIIAEFASRKKAERLGDRIGDFGCGSNIIACELAAATLYAFE